MNWKAELIKRKDEKRIAVYFEKKYRLEYQDKKTTGCQLSSTLRAWHLPDTKQNRQKFGIARVKSLNEIQRNKIVQFKRWLRSKRYSENTIKTYVDSLKTFLTFFNNKSVDDITNEDVILYLILNAHSNIKHKTMLSLIYGCVLRRSELLNLKPADIDSKRNIIVIRQTKGKKDRLFLYRKRY